MQAHVRSFPENAVRLLLEDPANLRDLMALAAGGLVRTIDFGAARPSRPDFVRSSHRRADVDLLFRAPLRTPPATDMPAAGTAVRVYVLVEHQSAPDRLMVLRVLADVVEILRSQVREWERRPRPRPRLALEPVLPVVLYTGPKRWDGVGSLVDLMPHGAAFAPHVPAFAPVFIATGALPDAALEAAPGAIGWALRLLAERRARPERFQRRFARAVERIAAALAGERGRLAAFFRYLVALVYHARGRTEHGVLLHRVERAVEADPGLAGEVSDMEQTMAEWLHEKGMKEGHEKGRQEGRLETARATLLRQLRARFGEVPATARRTIETTDDAARLDTWLDRVVTAERLEDVGIGG